MKLEDATLFTLKGALSQYKMGKSKFENFVNITYGAQTEFHCILHATCQCYWKYRKYILIIVTVMTINKGSEWSNTYWNFDWMRSLRSWFDNQKHLLPCALVHITYCKRYTETPCMYVYKVKKLLFSKLLLNIFTIFLSRNIILN